MKIKVIKVLTDLEREKRPRRGKIYEVLYIKHGLYNPLTNKSFVIDVNGNEVSIHTDECKIV